MKALVLLLLPSLLWGCRSTPAEERRHDYFSVNQQSREFIKETASQSPRIRRQNHAANTDLRPFTAKNKAERKEGSTFGWESAVGRPWQEFTSMLARGDEILREERKRAASEVRFGFLDSGD